MYKAVITNGLRVSAAAALFAGAAMTAQPAKAAEVLDGELSGNVGFFTDYVYRGFTQTGGEAAIQGGIDWGHESGFYVGSWGSNVDFGGAADESLEVDIYGGFSNSFESIPELSYDLGVLYYWYPGTDDSFDYNFVEFYGSLGYDFEVVSTSVGIAYSPDFFGGGEGAFYYTLGAEVPLPANFSLSGTYGISRFEDNTAAALPDYEDWNIGLGYSVWELDLSVNYTDTSDDAGDNGAVIFGVATAF